MTTTTPNTHSTTRAGGAGYLMDDPREADRVRAKVDAHAWVARYLRPHLCAGDRVLEVGCGPGHLLAAASSAVEGLAITGVDTSDSRLTLARELGVDIHLADAAALPFAPDSFDVVYTRFVLEYLPDPLQAVKELARVCRPGGTVMLQDLDGQLLNHYPPDPELEVGIRTVLTALAGRLDPHVGRALHSHALRAGLGGLTVAAESYHLIAGEADPITVEQWALKLEVARPAITTVLGAARAGELINRFLGYLRRPDTLTFSMLFTVTGSPPPTQGPR